MSTSELPFEHLNLRRNPFGQIAAEDVGAVAVVSLEDVVDALHTPGYAVQFIGAQGRGKTTHMRALHDHFPDAPFVYFGPDRRPPVPRAGSPLFLDETQRIPWWRRELLFRRRASFAVATHVDHTRQMRRCGLSVTTIEVGGLTHARLRSIVDRRIERVRRHHDAPIPALSDETLTALVERYGDDLRAIEHHLYEVFQRLEAVSEDVDIALEEGIEIPLSEGDHDGQM
jgi:hypothetical protein